MQVFLCLQNLLICANLTRKVVLVNLELFALISSVQVAIVVEIGCFSEKWLSLCTTPNLFELLKEIDVGCDGSSSYIMFYKMLNFRYLFLDNSQEKMM